MSALRRIISLLLLFRICSAQDIGNVHLTKSYLNRLQISDYFIPFEHCTLIVAMPQKNNSHFFNHSPFHAPITLHAYNINFGVMIETKFSLVGRRNKFPHCWATFALVPEKDKSFALHKKSRHFIDAPDFISPFWPDQYFIWVTTIKTKIQQYLKSFRANVFLNLLRNREIVIIEVMQYNNELVCLAVNNSMLRMHYHNIYHRIGLKINMQPSERWYIINCTTADCFAELKIVSKKVSYLNKYFWDARGVYDSKISSIYHLRTVINFSTMHTSWYGYHQVANLTTFNGFVRFWILQETFQYDLTKFTGLHSVPAVQSISLYPYLKGFVFVSLDVQEFSYASCYQVKSTHSDTIHSLKSPFDWSTWINLSICVLIVVLTSICISKKFICTAAFLVIGICLESSVLGLL